MLSDTEMLIRLLSAASLGSLIGFERERLLWAAGIRTHMLVCVGSCLFMLVSQYGFTNILTSEHVTLDPSRIAAPSHRRRCVDLILRMFVIGVPPNCGGPGIP